MKSRITAIVLAATVAGGALVLAGCRTAGTTAEDEAVMCAKCQTVWVRRAHTINKTTTYRNEKSMQCPDCDLAVVNFFKTGKFEHTCKTCGDSMKACKACR